MTTIHHRLEEQFRRMALLFFRHRWKTLTICIAFFAVFTVFTPRLRFDTSTEGFFLEGDSTIEDYKQFRDLFGRDDVVIVAIEPDRLFSAATLSRIRSLQEEIEAQLPYVDDVTSIINIRNVRGEDDQLIVEELVEKIPATPAAMHRLEDRVMSNHFYRSLIVSADGRITCIVVQLDTYDNGTGEDDPVAAGFAEAPASPPAEKRRYLQDAQVTEFISGLEKIRQRYDAPDFRIQLAGSPVVDNAIKRLISRDMALFTTISLVLISILLYMMFRRATGVLLPIIIVILSMISMLGSMAMFDIPITIVTQILSSFILVVGVADAVHILSIFYKELDAGRNRAEAMASAMAHSGLAVAMTSLTTAGGLISFAWADIAPVAHLGVFAAFGVMLAFLYTIALLPSLTAILPLSDRPSGRRPAQRANRGLEAVAALTSRHPGKIVIISLLLTLAAAAGLPQLRLSHNILVWLPRELPQRQATEMLDQRMQGTVSLEVIVDTGNVNGLYDHRVLNSLDNAAEQIAAIRTGRVFAGKIWSPTTVLKETHQALNENRSEFYAIPTDNELIAQEFLLFENSGAEDLEDVMDTRAQLARFTVKSPFEDAIEYVDFMAAVRNQLADHLPDASITMTGIMALFCKTVRNVMTSAVKSYLIALAVISLLMFVFLRKPSVAALSMMPNLIPIVMVLGFMGWAGIDLDSSNMLIGSIAIGLIVDDTVHFMHNFIRYYSHDRDTARAIRNTLTTTGRALLVTSLVLCCGFLVYGFSSLGNIFNFGLLTALAIVLALAADFFLAPALVTLWFDGRRGKKTAYAEVERT